MPLGQYDGLRVGALVYHFAFLLLPFLELVCKSQSFEFLL